MKIVGRKVILKPAQTKDVPVFFKWIHDPKTNRYLIGANPPKTLAGEYKWFNALMKNKNECLFSIFAKNDNKLIGNLGLHQINKFHKKCVIGIIIGEGEYRGKGYGTDAMKTALKYCFKTLRMHKIILTVDPENKRGLACYRKCGFKKEGYMEDDVYKNGKYHDAILMAVIC